jgi:hypothetical protein
MQIKRESMHFIRFERPEFSQASREHAEVQV